MLKTQAVRPFEQFGMKQRQDGSEVCILWTRAKIPGPLMIGREAWLLLAIRLIGRTLSLDNNTRQSWKTIIASEMNLRNRGARKDDAK